MSNFRQIDRDTGFLMPPSVDEWLPEPHLARFIVEVIAGLDLRSMCGSYRGSGSASYHPRVLLGLLVYGYATGVFSSRKIERATYDSVAFRFIAANDHPDHDTIATFRRRFLMQIEGLFVQVLSLAREMGVLKLGTVGLDGTKIQANANRHSALSYEHAGNIETQLKAEVADLMAKAEAADHRYCNHQHAACDDQHFVLDNEDPPTGKQLIHREDGPATGPFSTSYAAYRHAMTAEADRLMTPGAALADLQC